MRRRVLRAGRRPDSGHRPGVTLIDMTITVLIMGILAAVAVPKFSNAMAKLRAESVARRIAADLNYAQRVAVLTSSTVTITFTTTPAQYQMTGVANPDRPASAYAVNISEIDANVALSWVNFNGGMARSFNAYGRPVVGTAPLTAGTVTASSGGYSVTVTVDPSLGEAKVP